MRFTKMQALGNDYVYVNCFEEEVDAPSALALAVSPRHFGVGADGLILIQPSDVADVGMRIFNADGTEAEMCGNGLRCVARYAYEHGLCRREKMRVETGAGVKEVELHLEGGEVSAVTVNMGQPALRRSEIPMKGSGNDEVVAEKLVVGDTELTVTCVSMGNPHCVVPVEDVEKVRLAELGPRIENHEAFPERINVHFVEVLSDSEVKVVTWERGAGATLACGSGACAVCVAMNLLGCTGRRVVAHLPGGDLELEWREDGCVYMTGPAEEVFSGEWPE